VEQEQHLFEIEIICNIINGITLTFDQFNASLQNKSIYIYLFLILLIPNFGFPQKY